jgi:hypothetical protein
MDGQEALLTPAARPPDRASVELAIASERASREILAETTNEFMRRAIVQIRSNSLKEATASCLVAEIEFYDEGMAMAGGSEVGKMLLARKLEVLSRRNDQILTRAFGG